MTGGCNDEPNEKMNWGEPHYNKQNKGIMVCDGVSAHVCVRVCVCVSHYKTLVAHTHTCACNHYYFIIFIIFLTFSTFNIDLIGPVRGH